MSHNFWSILLRPFPFILLVSHWKSPNEKVQKYEREIEKVDRDTKTERENLKSRLKYFLRFF